MPRSLAAVVPSSAADESPTAEVAQIAEEAFVYGFPMVMNYAVLYGYFVDRSSPEYKAPPNQIYNTADGSLTIHIQKDAPKKDLESNWLPAPDGPIYLVMRLYWPKQTALDGTWQPPAVQLVK